LNMKRVFLCIVMASVILATAACGSTPVADTETAAATEFINPVLPEQILEVYMLAITDKDYEKMFSFTSENSTMPKEDFLARNKNIYEGI